MAKSECRACAWEEETGKTIDASRTKTSWAQEVGVSEASIRRHCVHSPIFQQSTSFVNEDGDALVASLDVPEEIVTSRGMSLRDPVTGSWQKVTWLPNKKALFDSLRYDDLKDALDNWVPVPFEPWTFSEGAAVLNIADPQIGKANQRGGGTPETLDIVKASTDAFAYQIIQTGVRTAVLVDNGDIIENCFNTPEQLVTNDLSVPDQITTARRMWIEIIKHIAPLVDKVYVVSIPSNHGAFRTGYKTPGGTVDADFGLEINKQLEDVVAENEHLTHVSFLRPEHLDEVAVLDVAGTRLAFAHGHRSGGVFKHGDWWKNIDHGRMAGGDADILVMGHFHTQAVYQSGDGRWVVGTASPEPGSDWFTNRTGEHSLKGLTSFIVHNGTFLSWPGLI